MFHVQIMYEQFLGWTLTSSIQSLHYRQHHHSNIKEAPVFLVLPTFQNFQQRVDSEV